MASQNAKRRARIRGNGGDGLTLEQWGVLLLASSGLCSYCRVNPATCADHYRPIALGGAHGFGNIAPACVQCNSRKGAKSPEGWILAQFGEDALNLVDRILRGKAA